MALGQHLGQLVAHALAADLVDQRRKLLDRRKRQRLDRILKARRKAHRPQHAQLVFLEAALCIADCAHDPGLQIVAAADKIQHAVAVQRIHEQAVDGEVAALHVLLRILRIAHLVGMPAVGVGAVIAKRRNLNVIRVLGRLCRKRQILRRRHQHYSELRAHRISFRKDPHDLRWRRVGRDIVVRRRQAQQCVAHAAAGEVGLKSALPQLPHDVGGVLFHSRIDDNPLPCASPRTIEV